MLSVVYSKTKRLVLVSRGFRLIVRITTIISQNVQQHFEIYLLRWIIHVILIAVAEPYKRTPLHAMLAHRAPNHPNVSLIYSN